MESKKNMKKRLPANIMHEGPLVIHWLCELCEVKFVETNVYMWECEYYLQKCNELCLKCEVSVMKTLWNLRFVKISLNTSLSTKYVWECEYILRSCNEDASTADCPAIWGRCSTCHPLNISRVEIAAERACHQKDKNTKIQLYEYNMKSMKHQRITV